MADEQCSVGVSANTDVESKKLSELRVIDLKAELKKRNLDTSGNKSVLMERLRRAIEEEGRDPDEIQLTTDTPSKKIPKRGSRVQKHEEVDDGVEDDSGDGQENETASQDQENEKVFEIFWENDKCEQPKEEVSEVEHSVNQEDSCIEPENPKEDQEVFVTIESADSTLDLDGDSNQGCEDEESKLFASDDRESKEQSTNKDTDVERTDLDKASGQSSQIHLNMSEKLENKRKPPDGEDVTMKSKDAPEESSAIKESSSKEDDQKLSLADEQPDKSITKDEKGQFDASSGKNLWVSGLSSTTRATDLKNLFSKYGKVVGAKVVTNARSPGARCYGFVTMSSSEDATKCINHLHRTELHGRMISVEKAKNEPAGKKSSDKKEHESKREKSSDWRHSTDSLGNCSSDKKDVYNKDDGKPAEKDKEESGNRTSDRSRASKSGSRDAERTVIMDKSKGEPVISVKTSSERSSKSQDRNSESKEKREMLSFDKIKKQREHERQRQREREIREMERQRERDKRVRERIIIAREREERERLRRERVRLEFERERLERERMERERLERERMRIEEERRIEQDRIQREREELRRQQECLRYEQDRRSGVRRPYHTDFRNTPLFAKSFVRSTKRQSL
ncbi:scaffold attachment factor B2-like isoform X2 [Bufo gargarizans]|uniref:scaffold attachment factor B2-like isoform X2 n=1 Tax=Bufo gargarizans TaxID=30331 RepID=UPI001CF2BB1F|nr:scaffold attachment factor B2-like isoform X2 [Bufo gargarizans]